MGRGGVQTGANQSRVRDGVGSSLEPIRAECGMRRDPAWSQSEQSVGRGGIQLRANQSRVWDGVGPSLEPIRAECGTRRDPA